MAAHERKIIIGTRGSELARAQTQLVEKAIQSADPRIATETVIIVTHGDKDRALNGQSGRKGLFTGELERALLAGEVHIAVHSAKDLPSETTPGAKIAAVLPRASIDDVLILKHRGGLASLPDRATIATGSVRRQHQLLWKRPDLRLVELRGNVPTRLRKLAENDWHAIILARAGLERLGVSANGEINFEGSPFFVAILPTEIFLPAGGQGIIAMQIRADDETTNAIVDRVNDVGTLLCLQAEREFLRALQGDCNCPVGVLAKLDDAQMRIRAQLFSAEAAAPREAEVTGNREQVNELAAELLRRVTE